MKSTELMSDSLLEIVASIAFLVAGYSLWAGISDRNYFLLVFGSFSVIAAVIFVVYAVYYGFKTLLTFSWNKDGEEAPKLVQLAVLVLMFSFVAQVVGLLHHYYF